MDYNNTRVVYLKVLAKERGLRGYSKLKKAELITFLQNNLQPTPASRTRPPRPTKPPPPLPQSVRFRTDRPRQRSSQEIDIFEQQETSKSQSQVTRKLNDWYDWLVDHVPKTIKDNASRAFKTFTDKIMGLYNRVTGNQTQQNKIEELKIPHKCFNPIELEQAFSGAYRSHRVNGRPRMDVDTFFERIRQNLVDLINKELVQLSSARVQTTAWIRYVQEHMKLI